MDEINYQKKIHKFRRMLKLEAGIRSGTMGMLVGLGGLVLLLVYGRLFYQKMWLTEGIPIAVGLFFLVTVVCYFALLRPQKKEVLARVDALGLEERIITMEEFKHMDTMMTGKQRKDAMEHLNKLDASDLKLQWNKSSLFGLFGLFVMVVLLMVLPFPKQEASGQTEQDVLEMELVDEMIAALKKVVDSSGVNEKYKTSLMEVVNALAASFTPEDSTLTRTAKIATASKRLDMLAASEQSAVALQKQQSVGTELDETMIDAAQAERKLLNVTIKEMKDIMGTSIDILNKVEGTFWTPGGPSSGTSYDVESLPTEEESPEGEMPPDGEMTGEEPPEGGEPTEGGELQDDMEGEWDGAGGDLIFDPEQGEVGYGTVYEEYYQELLKALTEQELSKEVREMVEDYANSLE